MKMKVKPESEDRSGILYESICIDHYEEILPIAIDEFVLGEPITQGMDAVPADFEPMLRVGIKNWIEEGISFCARDGVTRQLIGVMIATLVKKDDSKSIWSSLKSSNEKTYAYVELEKIMESAVDVFEDPSIHLVLEQNLLCIHPKYRKRGIGKTLAQLTEDHGRKLGCQVAVVEASHIGTQKIFSGLSYETKFEYFYKDFQICGKNIFDLSKMNGTVKNTIMVKKL